MARWPSARPRASGGSCAWGRGDRIVHLLGDQLGDFADLDRRFLAGLADAAATSWQEADHGIWEIRGARRDFVHSKVMAWAAVDRAVRGVEDFGLDGPVNHWRAVRDEIQADVIERGYSEDRKAFTQAYGSDVLDASNLLMPLVQFIAPRDPRWLTTLDAITEELVSDSLVYRYDPEASPDGLKGDEGTFSM